MGRFKKSRGATGYDTDASDSSISELSHDSSINSKSSAFRFGRRRGKKRGSNGTASVGSASSNSRRAAASPKTLAPKGSLGSTSVDGTARSVDTANTTSSKMDKKRLMKDAKSRFNIGLVYLKTGDYAKAQENLENSLFCHIQLSGHESKAYTNDTIFAIASVREKLGDCFLANPAVVDKFLASDNYEESRRLLKSVDPEDAADNITEMLQRVEEKLKEPELSNTGSRTRRKAPSFIVSGMEGNMKANASVRIAAAETARGQRDFPPQTNRKTKNTVFGKGFEIIQDLAHEVADGIADVAEGIKDIIDDSSYDDASRKSYLSDVVDWFETAMAHLERDNHRTALNYLRSVQEGGSMKNSAFRRQMADSMLKVASSAFAAEKINVALDAYEEALTVLKHDKDDGDNDLKLALKGCIRCNKMLAIEMEGIQDYGSAILHRTRAYQLLDEDDRTVPACQQRVKVAYLHGKEEEYTKSTVALSEAIGRLFKGVISVDNMASDRRDLLVQCYQMQAICYTKLKKWNDALEQYDEVLPLVAKKEGNDGQSSEQYNSMLIHKSVLLVTIGDHRLAASTLDKYLKNAKVSQRMAGTMVVDDMDHALALDTYAAMHLKLDEVDKAISIFHEKLAFVKTLPNNDGLKSDTLHKLGCLLANKSQPATALPLLNESLRTKNFFYDGNHRSVLETTWAVAATNQTLGDNHRALKEYSLLLEKMTNIDELPVDTVIIHHSVGKLFFEDGKVDKAIQSFHKALHGSESSSDSQLKSEITLNLANALSAQGEVDKAMKLYGELLNNNSLKKTKISFLARFDRSLLLIKMGEVEKAKGILHKIAETRSTMANDVRGKIYLTLGNLAILDGNIDEALGYFENALDEAEDDDISAIAHTKKSIAMAQLESGQTEKAISTLEDILEDLSYSSVEGKSVNLLQAEIWNCLARVYKEKGDLPQAKNFAKLALQTYKVDLGGKNPITLRNVANLQLLLLEEAEDLDKSEAKSTIDAAKYELEETLEAFVSLDDPWTYRLDVASLKTNLGLVAVWQEKPKKARKLVQQIKEIELPAEHPIVHRITVLEERLGELENKGGNTRAAVDTTPKSSKIDDSTKESQRSRNKSKRRKGKKQK